MDKELRVEAALFASGKYLEPDYLAELTGLSVSDVEQALEDLQDRYSREETSIGIFEEMGKWKMNVVEQYTHIVEEVVSEAELPDSVMKTLALIAYKSPVLQSDIVEARGQTCYSHIRDLEDREFIDREREGRTYKITVTDKFYEYFDLEGSSDVQDIMGDVDVEEPDVQEEVEEENDFDEKISERIKKLERTEQDVEEEKEFLDSVEDKLGSVKENVDDVVDSEEFEEDEDQA